MGCLTMTPPPADNFAARVFLGPEVEPIEEPEFEDNSGSGGGDDLDDD
jgi:hypothetical protein